MREALGITDSRIPISSYAEALPIEKPEGVAKAIAETELLDPKSPDMMFEQMTTRSLFDPLRGRLRAMRGRRSAAA